MTSALPSGEGTPGGAGPDGAFEPDSAPDAAGLEPDTAPDAAGEQDTSAAAAGPGDDAGQPLPGQPLLGDPALDNEDEMQQAGADLQSSREKTATARDISNRLTAATRPEKAEGERS